jgi:hypothetical protein
MARRYLVDPARSFTLGEHATEPGPG